MDAASAILLALSALGGAGSCVPAEREALLGVKHGFSGDWDGVLASWDATRLPDCCRWAGVICDNNGTGRVIELRLRNAFADADAANPGLSSEISPALTNLTRLEYLDLSWNSIFVPKIPRFLGSLSSLRHLNLSHTGLDGEIPPQLGNLSHLVSLDRSSNGLYSSDLSWLTGLSSLEHLDMSHVNLSASVNWQHDINTLPSLRVLALSDCGLTSSPSSSHINLTRLQWLDLSSNGIKAWFWNVPSLRYLDLSSNALSGPFPDALGNMTWLQRLDLSWNGINSSTVDAWFWNVPTLPYLDLSFNLLSGLFPDALGNMTHLQELYLDGNSMVGMIPATLQRLCNLQVVHVSWNQINGDMSEFMDRLPRCALSHVQVLHLSATNMSGELPQWIGDMSELMSLDLSYNNLVGDIPLGIGRLSKLTKLFLFMNNMNGRLTEKHFSNMVSLEWIDLSQNSMSMEVRPSWRPPCKLIRAYFSDVKMGPLFPAWIKHQPDITHLDISHAGIIDTLPHWFWKSFSDAVYLNISVNQISGRLPSSLRFMTSAKFIYLRSNNLTGSMPLLPKKLRVLDLSSNSLSGPIPSEFSGPYLMQLDVSYNRINGTVPASLLCQHPDLLLLDLSNNNLSGHLPQCKNISSDGLKLSTLILYKNNLSGEFPVLLKHCHAMKFLDLAQNMFYGILPEWIGRKLSSLTHLRLRSNMFSGNIPTQLAQLGGVQLLDLAGNLISGCIPRSLGNITGMTKEHTPSTSNPIVVYSSSYDTPGSNERLHTLPIIPKSYLHIITKGQDRLYTNGVIYMVSLDLSDNVLNGEIPKEMSYLSGLVNLNLSRNQLTGTIPRNISDLQKLESLDLSMNELSGAIPSSLSDLTSLGYLNLSYNNLSGRIPSGNQLQVLPNLAYIYIGNVGLCGPPLSKKCSSGDDDNNSIQTPPHGDKDLSKISVAVGFVVGLWLVFCSLLFVKMWRFAYFQTIDKAYDVLYVFVAIRLAKCSEMITTTNSTD